jgi:hypothetical protein
MSKSKRWHKWSCRFGKNRTKEAEDDIRKLQNIGFKAKVWSVLPQHKTSEHVHVSVLCTSKQLSALRDWIESDEIDECSDVASEKV